MRLLSCAESTGVAKRDELGPSSHRTVERQQRCAPRAFVNRPQAKRATFGSSDYATHRCFLSLTLVSSLPLESASMAELCQAQRPLHIQSNTAKRLVVFSRLALSLIGSPWAVYLSVSRLFCLRTDSNKSKLGIKPLRLRLPLFLGFKLTSALGPEAVLSRSGILFPSCT